VREIALATRLVPPLLVLRIRRVLLVLVLGSAPPFYRFAYHVLGGRVRVLLLLAMRLAMLLLVRLLPCASLLLVLVPLRLLRAGVPVASLLLLVLPLLLVLLLLLLLVVVAPAEDLEELDEQAQTAAVVSAHRELK